VHLKKWERKVAGRIVLVPILVSYSSIRQGEYIAGILK
jgi:hypothetical protein